MPHASSFPHLGLPLSAISRSQRWFLSAIGLVLATGCAQCDRSTSYVRSEADADGAEDVGADLRDALADSGEPDLGDTAVPRDVTDVATDTAPDIAPDLGLVPECPWALSGCVALGPTDPEDCGPLGCGLAAPATVWVDALPCLRLPVQVTLPSTAAPWQVLNSGVDNGAVAFDLAAPGRGQTHCAIGAQGITFYPELLTCQGPGQPAWTTRVGMNAAACLDCPSIEGCYVVEGFDAPHAIALFQEGCVVTSVAGEPGGRTLPQVGAVGPDGQLIFREIGQVADTICGLSPPEQGGGYEGFACAHSQVGLPGDIVTYDDVRLDPAPWSDCAFVECVEDADCAGDPDGEACVRGRCAMR